ncbi:pyridoxal phosphate-dependent decarboxylase family protein [Arthrobacter sp. zg-Y895]|uniref:pyridoxal phosphate-dependent decarboxylase family protein n=1 Tax=Arthrobacter sp. zg-Y895 TaxID=2886933 RepID=UPI0022B19F77|nr:aspartate aminotransferase family protein [Arthrobacter sp. zg-Y895]
MLHHAEPSGDVRFRVDEAFAGGHLLNAANIARYAAEMRLGVDAAAAAVSGAGGPFTGITPAELKPVVDAVDLETPLPDTAAALAELESVYLRDAVYFHHPKYAAHLNCPVVIPALVGEAVLSTVNSSLDTWDQSAGATLIEQRLIRWTANRLGLGENADGVFTSGGSASNQQALLMARNRTVAALRQDPERKSQRLPELLAGLRIFASEASHFSIRKSASILGLGYDAVVPVPCDDHQRMDPDALADALAASAARGEQAMAVVATAGTTDFGSIDPLLPTARLAEEHGAWLHVDAAYGGGLITSQRYRHLLDGIGAADSVTVDFHKTFFQPVSSSAVLVRERAMLNHVTYYADYLNPESAARAAIPNQVDKSIQTTRRFDALKLWLTLRVLGADGVGSLLDAAIDLASATGLVVGADPEFEMAAPVQLSTLVFRYHPGGTDEDSLDAVNLHIRRALSASGEALVAGTKVAGRHYLKFTLLNADTTLTDMRAILEQIRRTGSEYLAGAAA